MRWLWLALALGGCAVTAAPAPAPIYFCYRTQDGDGDPLTLCEPHSSKGYKFQYNPVAPQSAPAAPPQHHDRPLDIPRT